MPTKFYILLLIILTGGIRLSAQQADEPQCVFLSGYVKNLNIAYGLHNDFFDTLYIDNLIHNRLNFRWDMSEKWTLRSDLRTRIFYGELVKLDPNYAAAVNDSGNDFFDLDFIIVDRPALVMHTIMDRAYLEYVSGDWELRLGRQRINWGINTVWNPNDIFNAFAFTDFDYEERPGSDALRLTYYTGFASSVEFAVKAFDDWKEVVAAGLVKWNKWNYDFQVLGGIMERDLVLGAGWAGNVKTASFKGELSYFYALEDDEEDSFAATLGLDYTFKSGFYFSGGFLFNNNGSTDASIANLFNFELSAKNLYPYKYAVFVQGNHSFTPLITGGLAVIYSPGKAHALFLNPTFSFSIAQNWDLTLVGQLVFNQEADQYRSPVRAVFMRTKWSF